MASSWCANKNLNDPHAETEIHSVKVINLKTNRVPTPVQLTGVSIDKLNRADFFRWEQPGIIGVDRDSLPELTTLSMFNLELLMFES